MILVVPDREQPDPSGDEQLYGYAVGVLAGTAVQFAMALPQLSRLGFRLQVSFHFRDPRVRKVLLLMLPVTIGLGLINFNLLINSTLGSLVSDQAARAIDAAFRIYMLPQGMFSVAIATVLFPALSRLAARKDLDGLRALTANGMRQVFLLLIPAAAATLALATPITRLIYQHGAFGPGVDRARLERAVLVLVLAAVLRRQPAADRTFFSLQRPWITTGIAALNLGVNVAVSVALYKPFGIAGHRGRDRGVVGGDDARADPLPAPPAPRAPRRAADRGRRREDDRRRGAARRRSRTARGRCSTRRSGAGSSARSCPSEWG